MNIKQIAEQCGFIVDNDNICIEIGKDCLYAINTELTAFANALIGDSEPYSYTWSDDGVDKYTNDKDYVESLHKRITVTPLFTKPPSTKDAEHMMTITKSSYFAMEKQTADRRAECEQDKIDARRYRWLRGSAGNEILDKLKTKITFDSFDGEIDLALKGE